MYACPLEAAAHITFQVPGPKAHLEAAQIGSTPFWAALERSTIETSVKLQAGALNLGGNRDAGNFDLEFHQVVLLEEILAAPRPRHARLSGNPPAPRLVPCLAASGEADPRPHT